MRWIAACLFFVAVSWNPALGQNVAVPDIEHGLKRAVEFYSGHVSTEGGYHFRYAADLSFGRSESAQGPTQISVQREGTPVVGMAYLEAFDATDEQVYLDAAVAAARALVHGQHCSGGWDYIIEFAKDERADKPYRVDGPCEGARALKPYTTLDDNTTQAALRLLMRVDRALEFRNEEIHGATEYALAQLMRVQYPNGAWPQRFFDFPDPENFPVKQASYPESWSREWPGANYRSFYTLNDNTLADMIDMYLEAWRIYGDERYRSAAERGGDFILLAQMPEPQPAWAQQYDLDMHPAWARLFEPPAVTGGESQSAMRILLTLFQETGDTKYLEPIPRALEYLNKSALARSADEPVRKQRSCPGEAPCLARFYELRTNRPLFITKGTMIRVADQSSVRPDGYELSYSDDSTIQHYGMWSNGAALAEIEDRYETLRVASSRDRQRPDQLHGLSPWQERPIPEPSDQQVRAIVDALDDRGAWTEPGAVGKAGRLVSIYAPRDYVVVIGDRSFTLKEDETLEVFPGEIPPAQRVITSATFARNVVALSRWLVNSRR